jgi:hypothetical protein
MEPIKIDSTKKYPIKFRCEWDWGQTLYYINDSDKTPYTLVNITLTPGDAIYVISHCGEECEAYAFELTDVNN